MYTYLYVYLLKFSGENDREANPLLLLLAIPLSLTFMMTIIDFLKYSGESDREAIPLLLLLATLLLLAIAALAAFYRRHWGHKLPVRSLSICASSFSTATWKLSFISVINNSPQLYC